MKESFEEINDLDINLTCKVLIRSEYSQILQKYYYKILQDPKDLSQDKIKVYEELNKLMKEEKISSEYKLFTIHYDKLSKQIIINFTITIKIEKKFLLVNQLYSKAEIIIDYNIKEIFYYMSDLKLFYFIADEMVSYIDLENINCKTKDELHKKEREYIEKFKDIIVNKITPIITKIEDNERNKKYRIEHKEEIKQYQKEHYENNKQELKQRNKIYRENHKEELKQKTYKYREEHNEEIKAYDKIRKQVLYDCKCGIQIQKGSKTRHDKTKFHLEHI